MAELVAQSLRLRIIDGDLPDGAELPREAALVQEFGVSRPSLREALRILETEGLVRIRRGKIGGGIVRCPTEQSAAYHLGLTLQSRGTTLRDLAQARAVLEPACAEFAATQDAKSRRRLVKALATLIDENEACMDDSIGFTSKALDFHAAIVEACGNTTIALLTGALEAMWNSQERFWARRATSDGEYPDIRSLRDVIKAHRCIVTAIEKGDTVGAAQLMRAHLAHSQPYVSEDDRLLDILAVESGIQAGS
jgi:GntR family transcriptional repressor for pyruvate dehydrogenase complex